MRDIRSEIDKINEIVSMPTILAELMSELNKGDAATYKIVRLVETDPALTGNILRVVNSPYYGLRWRVNSVSSAIALLGISETSRLLIAFYMKQRMLALNEGQSGYLDLLWKHSVNTATVARLIVKEFGILTGGKEFTAGLLHDMGKIVLVQYFPNELNMVNRMVKELDLDDVQAENQVVAISHTDIGGLLADKWRLPLEFSEVMRLHHAPALAELNPELTTVIRFADLLAESWGNGVGEKGVEALFEGDESFELLATHEPRMKAMGFEEVVSRLGDKFVEQKSLVGLF